MNISSLKFLNQKKKRKNNLIAKERANNILSNTYREILQARIEMISKLPRYVLIHDLEREDIIFYFTK